MKKSKKVEIIIEEKAGKISVSYQANSYGASYLCQNEDEVDRAIASHARAILKAGDMPYLNDARIHA